MKKNVKKNRDLDSFDQIEEFRPRQKNKKQQNKDFEGESDDKLVRKFGQKDSKRVRLKGNQWEDWVS